MPSAAHKASGAATKAPPAPKPPSGLGTAGRALWRDVLREFDLRPEEIRILDQACRVFDGIRRLEAAMAGVKRLTTSGSRGQEVAHPLIAELRSERLAFARLCRQLGLPDDSDGAGVSSGARALARARWRTS